MNAEQKEKFLEMLSDAIDKSEVSIHLTFYGLDKSKVDALEEASRFSEIINSDVTISKGDIHDWYTVKNGDFYAGFFHRRELGRERVAAV